MERLFRFRLTPWFYVLVAVLVLLSLVLGSFSSTGPGSPGAYGAPPVARAQSAPGSPGNATGTVQTPFPSPQPAEPSPSGDVAPAEPEPSPKAPGNGTGPAVSPSPSPQAPGNDTGPVASPSATPQPSPEAPGNGTNPDLEPPGGPRPAEPKKTTALVEPDREAVVKSASGKIAITVPAGAVSETLRVELTEHGPGFFAGRRIINVFELEAYAVKRADAKVSRFEKELQIAVAHAPGELGGLDVNSLRLYYLDEATAQWVPVPGSRYDPETDTLTAGVDHFTTYGVTGEPLICGPGNILASQVGLHSGAATYTYPIEVPPGVGGFQPKIVLSYDSGVVSEMKDWLDVGSWVGIGWTLHMGRINYDEGADEYCLDFGGGRLKLARDTTDPGIYHTVPEAFYRVTRSGETWSLYDRDGVYYEFGGTADSQQYYFTHEPPPSGAPINLLYRWDLNLIRGLHSEQVVTVSYVQDRCTDEGREHVRSAYPQYVRYNNNQVEIKFNSSHDNDGQPPTPTGPLRNDNYAGNISGNWVYPPHVVENRKLDSIEIKANGSLVRKYQFAYLTQPPGSGVAGNHTLTSITELGADGVSALPVTTFTYEGKRLYLYSTCTGVYYHYPNTAWCRPYLTRIDNGYGGVQGFVYKELPSEPVPADVWTRQVVKTSTLNPGIGPPQTHEYYYKYDAQGNDGSPEYLGRYPFDWCAEPSEYLGFSKVKVKDAAGDYTVHYYYTRGYPFQSEEGEFLKGKEYRTEWFSSSDTLLKKQEYTWNYRFTSPSWIDGLRVNASDQSRWKVAADSDGYVYMTHYGNDTVCKYDGWYNLVGSWGGSGNASGEFRYPYGIAACGAGEQTRVYVADTNNRRVQRFSGTGVFQCAWPAWSTCSPWGVAVDTSGYVYVLDSGGNVTKYDGSGVYQNLRVPVGQGSRGLTVDSMGCIYVTQDDYVNGYVKKYSSTGEFVGQWGGSGNDTGEFLTPDGIRTDSSDHIYVADRFNSRVQEFASDGSFLGVVGKVHYPRDVALRPTTHGPYDEMVVCGDPGRTFAHPYFVYLEKVETTVGDKVSRTRYVYDDYGNVITEYSDGDTSTSGDDSTVHRVFYPNTTSWIVNEPARERVYATITDDVGGANLKAETRFCYDGLAWGQPPTKGDLTQLERLKNAGESVSTYHTYDAYGNPLTETDPNSNTTTFTYYSGFPFPVTVTYPTVDSVTLQESYSWDYASGNMLSVTDANGQVTGYEYDTFKRLTKAIKPGDSSASPTVEYQYNNWGTLGQQHLKKLSKISAGDYAWRSQYFDGVGRVVQTHACGETGYTVIESTTTYNSRGLEDRGYVSQVLASGSVNGYYSPAGDWKYTSYAYDGLGRVTTQTNPDGTTIGHDYSTAWKDLVTNQRGYKKANYYDAFERLTKVEEYNESQSLYSTTTYAYDVLNNLTQVTDNAGNTIGITYDWLSRKTGMSDPDMGQWSYTYDNNSNLASQTDARGLLTAFAYDALNRLTSKVYPVGSGTANVYYEYDGSAPPPPPPSYDRGRRTGMTDAAGSTRYAYDSRGRLIQEARAISGANYTTNFAYDSADRLSAVTYPTGETVTQTYNGRGLPYSLSGTLAGNVTPAAYYNKLGEPTQICFGNGMCTNFGYWGVGGAYDSNGGYYGRLWEIKTYKTAGLVQDVRHSWDAAANLIGRYDVISRQYEAFGYDFLDRLFGAGGPYSHTYSYNTIGNILSMNGTSYAYGAKPHAVTAVGSTSYSYDANGNMISRGGTAITWDVENRPTAIGNATFVYDGDGARARKTEGGQTTVYVNKYYEKNLTTGVVTTYYYLGDRLVAHRNGSSVYYVHEDHLTGTSVVTNTSGTVAGSIKYYPYGSTRSSSGSLYTDKKFTGQRLDATGLYYYGARYYDPAIGRFISADTMVPDRFNPQGLNRYSYVLNNPLKYTDPTGHFWDWIIDLGTVIYDVVQLVRGPSWENGVYLAGDVVLGVIPFVPAGLGYLGKADDALKAADKVEGIAGDAATGLNKAGDVADAARSASRFSEFDATAQKAFRNGEYIETTLQPGDVVCRAHEIGKTGEMSHWAMPPGTASLVDSPRSAREVLAIDKTSGARPNRIVEYEVTRPVVVKYGLIEDGAEEACQYWIDDIDWDALEAIGERMLE